MAKELPYFRFTASEWQNGDISLENYELKGLFIDICAYYWVKDCSITREMLEKRFRNDKELLKELFIIEVIKENKDFISIRFLDEQFDMLSEKRKRRQEAGAIGGRTKSSNAKAKLKQKSSYKDKDNNKDKDKDKDINKNIDEIYSLYPTKCPTRNASTNKSKANKAKIKSLLKDHTVDKLKSTIEKYVSDCTTHKVYLKNFSTFLNQLPDFTEEETNKPKMCLMQSKYSAMGREIEKTYDFYLRELREFGEENVKLIKML